MKTHNFQRALQVILGVSLFILVGIHFASAQGLAGQLMANDWINGDRFGGAVAIDQDRMVVGCIHDSDNPPYGGCIYIFELQGNGTWLQIQKFTNDNTGFGSAVAIFGDWIIVGDDDDSVLADSAGAAYIYKRQPNGVWTEVQKIYASNPSQIAGFGTTISLYDDRVLIGAPWGKNSQGVMAGAVYVFERQTTGQWTEVQKLIKSGGVQFDSFGSAISLKGNRAVISATSDITTSSVFIFERDTAGTWSQVQELTSGTGPLNISFGRSISLFDNRVAIGSLYSVFIFERQSSGSWLVVQTLQNPDTNGNDLFGSSVALGNDTIFVGDFNSVDLIARNVYVFERFQDGVWRYTQKLKYGSNDSNFGRMLAIAGQDIVVGAPSDTINDKVKGSVYLFNNCLETSSMSIPVSVEVAPQAGGPAELQQIGTIDIIAGPGSSIKGTFTLKPEYAYLDYGYDFQWINVEKSYSVNGIGQLMDPIVGLLPAMDPQRTHSEFGDELPYYLPQDDWDYGYFGPTEVHKEGQFSRFFDARFDSLTNSTINFHTYLVAHDIAANTLSSKTFSILAGYSWRFENLLNETKLCAPLTLGAPLTNSALVAGINCSSPHAGCPGYPGWSAIDGAALGPIKLLTNSSSTLSIASGGTVTMSLDAGPKNAGSLYWLIGSVSGSSPGLSFGPYNVPVNNDPYLNYTILNPNFLPLGNAFGFFDSNGKATATFWLPPGLVVLPGVNVTHSFMVFPWQKISVVSNPTTITLVP
jgi:hypothetical protein